jgi:hypothetical protein
VTADFVANENIDHYLAMLQNPRLEPETQRTLQQLLVEEQNKLGRNREQLELAERRVHEGRERIRKLSKAVAHSGFGDDAQHRLRAIATMKEIQRLFESYHRQLRDELLPFCVLLRQMPVTACRTFDEAQRQAQQFANANRDLVVLIVDRSNGDSHVVDPE